MRTLLRRLLLVPLLAFGVIVFAAPSDDQDRGNRRPDSSPRAAPRPAPRPPLSRRHVVFIGGYFYDPFFGPYPWWMRDAYPYPYFPLFDRRAEVRLDVKPRSAMVYVDGFYAGIVDDFDGVFQALPLPPGGHTIEFYLEGFRTIRRSVYLVPASRLKLHETLERTPAGMASDAPMLAPPVPPPPDGTSRPPATAQPASPPSREASTVRGSEVGTLRLTVQPEAATVMIDGERWLSSESGRFVIELPKGRHRLDVTEPGYHAFSQDIEIREGDTLPLNVSLMK